MAKLIGLLLGAWALGASCMCIAAGYEVSNSYFYLAGKDGWFDTLKLDPAGQGRYGESLIASLSIGAVPEDASAVEAERSGDTLLLRGAAVRMPFKIEQAKSPHPTMLQEGHTLGVKFTVASGKLIGTGGKFPTWGTANSGCTISLYRLPDGNLKRKELIATRKLANVPDNSIQNIEFAPQSSGVFYLEMSEPVGTIGWWGSRDDLNPTMTAYLDGVEIPNADFVLVYSGFNEVEGDLTVKLDGSKMQIAFQPSEPNPDLTRDGFVCIVTPWEKNGYDVSKFPFSRFYTDTGRHMLVQQLKRRPHSDQLQSGKWIYAMGKGPFDIRFDLASGQRLRWEFADDAMTWKFNGLSLNLEVLPHNPKLPSYYPVFYSSNKKYDKILNEFYYSHALNFGVGTPPDWKEWQALILDWTANPQVAEQRGHFTGVAMRPDGYVYSWGKEEGWPFPFKDEDGDGKNDYDTRHFTTNSTFILGAYRYFCWTRDKAFLTEMMPKLRQAMAFLLNDLQGRKGVIVINAPGHEGRNDGIGSNYWDILPFGYKDAFCNSYYYEALRAMADLEKLCQDAGFDFPGPKQSPVFYNALRAKVRRSYNQNFWDDAKGRYVGCVDVDGVKHDYGFTFVNVEAMAYGLADRQQAERVYNWMETEKTSTGKADTYSAWLFAPRANAIHNPPRSEGSSKLQVPSSNSGVAPSPTRPVSPSPPAWWHFGWGGTPFGDQCQDGGAILYTSFYDVVARARLLSADNAYQRLTEILDRYDKPDRLCGGSPLYRGEATQGGPGGSAGSVGVEGEFPESGLAPTSFLYAFIGVDADTRSLRIRPNLPSCLEYAGVRNLCYGGQMYDIKVTRDTVEVKVLGVINRVTIKKKLRPVEAFVLTGSALR